MTVFAVFGFCAGRGLAGVAELFLDLFEPGCAVVEA